MRALQAELSSLEFTEWLASERLDPPEEDRADVRHAHLMLLLANINRGPKQMPYKLSDFVLRWDDPMTPEKRAVEALAIAEAMATMRARRKPD